MYIKKTHVSFALIATFLCNTDYLISSNSTIPVVFIHRSNSYYLKDCLWQAKQYNKRVVLIGDDTNNVYNNLGIEHYNMCRYFKGASNFRNVYHHIHARPFEKQIFNFQRWFILQEFMGAHNITKVMYLDSDVMLYCNISKEAKYFENHDIALVIPRGHAHCGSNSFWTLDALKSFTRFLMQFYSNQDNLIPFLEWFHNTSKPPTHGVGDMKLLKEYAYWLEKYKAYTMTNICSVINNARFDHQLSDDCGGTFQMKKVIISSKEYKIKDLVWRQNRPYCYNSEYKRMIRLKSLHCQGNKKKLMSSLRRSKKN